MTSPPGLTLATVLVDGVWEEMAALLEKVVLVAAAAVWVVLEELHAALLAEEEAAAFTETEWAPPPETDSSIEGSWGAAGLLAWTWGMMVESS